MKILNFAQTLKALRKSKKVRQNYLASILGFSPNALSNWESGTREPNLQTLCALADYFDVTTDQLLGRVPLPNAKGENEVKNMTKDQGQRLENCLLEFIERVSKGGATTESEVQVLPTVAQVLVKLSGG